MSAGNLGCGYGDRECCVVIWCFGVGYGVVIGLGDGLYDGQFESAVVL